MLAGVVLVAEDGSGGTGGGEENPFALNGDGLLNGDWLLLNDGWPLLNGDWPKPVGSTREVSQCISYNEKKTDCSAQIRWSCH